MDGGFDVAVSSLPLATVNTAADGQPGVEGAPTFHFIDGRGHPPPWKDGAKDQIRYMPPGPLGELVLGRDGYWVPHFEKTEWRGMGYGDVRSVDDKGKPNAVDPFKFRALNAGPNGTLSFDYVEGKIDELLKSNVRKWIHADAAPVAYATLFAFREPTEKGELLHVVMPEAVRELESLEVDVDGAFLPSRFSRRWSFSDYVFPLSPDLGKTAVMDIDEDQVRHFSQVAKSDKKSLGRVVLDVNGTEPETLKLRIRFSSEP